MIAAPTIGTLFSGFEGVGCGAKAAGLQHAWGFEYDDRIADVARGNGFNMLTEDATTVDPAGLAPVDVLHASPPCPNFSVAKANRAETANDKALAATVCRFIETLHPRVFTLENVTAYAKSESFQVIVTTLARAGYMLRWQNINAADFGVPQTRRRLWLRAVRDGLLPELPAPEPWQGWYDAIADLIPGLPESAFAPWQLARLSEEIKDTILVDNTNCGRPNITMRGLDQPSMTVTTRGSNTGGRLPRAFIVSNGNAKPNAEGGPRIVQQDKPMMTVTGESGGRVRAFIVPGGNSSSFSVRTGDEPMRTVGDTERVGNLPRAWLSQGHVVAMTPRCLARFQTFPDWYALPENNVLACKGIGNAVPPLLYQKLIGGML